ncbi:MAG: hypothetical protein WCT03_26435 [Candidatus Obscuribacterales bacterium]
MKNKYKTLSLLLLLAGFSIASTSRAFAAPPGFLETLANENAVQSAINNANAKSAPPPPPKPPTPPG